MNTWKLDIQPKPYEIRYKNAKYAVLLVMAGDNNLGEELDPDRWEMTQGVSEEVAALVLMDFPGEGVSRVFEIVRNQAIPVQTLGEELDTGDPRPISDFFARALVSFTTETRFAVGFWGHGLGAFGDLDPDEVVLDRELRFGPLGVPIADGDAVTERTPRVKKKLSRSMLPDASSHNALTNRETSSALTVAFSRARRTEPVDMLFFDTCLNGSVEVFAELRKFARAFVASSLPIPGAGWRYDVWLKMTAEAKPATASEWAVIAVKLYELVYDQRTCKEAAHLVATDTGIDFIEPLADLVRALVRRGTAGALLAARAAQRAPDITFTENRDLYQMVSRIREMTDDDEIKGLAEAFLERHREATICRSMDPPKMEGLSGMTIWCPIFGDLEHVGSYYKNFEFNRLSGWSDLLEMDARPALSYYAVNAFWAVDLVEECALERSGMTVEDEGPRLWLAIPEERRAFAEGLVEGEYTFRGKPMVARFPNGVVLRELYRTLQELGENYEFEALRGCHQSGWLAGGAVCAELLESLEKWEREFVDEASSSLDIEGFWMVKKILSRVGPSGVLLTE